MSRVRMARAGICFAPDECGYPRTLSVRGFFERSEEPAVWIVFN